MSESQNLTAINIALIPDSKSRSLLMDCSQQLDSSGGEGLLQKDSAHPHITLWMGLVNDEDLKEVLSWIRSFDLKIILHENKLVHATGTDNSKLVHLTFEDSDLIGYLHRSIHERMELMMVAEQSRAEMFSGDAISESTLKYSSEFHNSHSLVNFKPHATIGYGELPQMDLGDLVFDKVSVFQLGNHCTCAKNLLNPS